MVLVTPDQLILPELGVKLGAYAQRKLASRGIEILTQARVAGYRNGSVLLQDGRSVPACTLVWTAGNTGNPLVASLPLPNRAGRLLVNDYLEVENAPGIWALGDCALVPNPRSKGFHPLPRNTHCAKAALLPAILRRKSWALKRGPSATPLWASWLRSDAELAWPTSWECSFPGLLPGGRFWLQVGFRSWELPTMSTQPGADGIEQVAFGFMAS